MYYAYVLFSKDFNRFYNGHCKQFELLLKQQNAEQTKSSKPFVP